MDLHLQRITRSPLQTGVFNYIQFVSVFEVIFTTTTQNVVWFGSVAGHDMGGQHPFLINYHKHSWRIVEDSNLRGFHPRAFQAVPLTSPATIHFINYSFILLQILQSCL